MTRYTVQLEAAGVRDYDAAQCLADYRAALLLPPVRLALAVAYTPRMTAHRGVLGPAIPATDSRPDRQRCVRLMTRTDRGRSLSEAAAGLPCSVTIAGWPASNGLGTPRQSPGWLRCRLSTTDALAPEIGAVLSCA